MSDRMTAEEMENMAALNNAAILKGPGESVDDDRLEALEVAWYQAAALTRIAEALRSHVLPRGCVCPAGAEVGCRGPMCPRRGRGEPAP